MHPIKQIFLFSFIIYQPKLEVPAKVSSNHCQSDIGTSYTRSFNIQ